MYLYSRILFSSLKFFSSIFTRSNYCPSPHRLPEIPPTFLDTDFGTRTSKLEMPYTPTSLPRCHSPFRGS